MRTVKEEFVCACVLDNEIPIGLFNSPAVTTLDRKWFIYNLKARYHR